MSYYITAINFIKKYYKKSLIISPICRTYTNAYDVVYKIILDNPQLKNILPMDENGNILCTNCKYCYHCISCIDCYRCINCINAYGKISTLNYVSDCISIV